MIRRPPRSTQSRSSAASDVYKRQVLHDDLRGGRALASHLVEGCARRQTRRPLLDDEGGDSLVLPCPVDVGEHHVDIRDRRVGDEGLGAVEDVTITLPEGLSLIHI